MKRIILNRHAKSDWDNPKLTDYERVLSKRGLSDAPLMAKKFAERNIPVDFLYSSSAVRAKTTAEYFIKELKLSENNYSFEREIYGSGISFIRTNTPNLSNQVNCVMYFGHNPDFTSLITYFSGEVIGNLPTCGIAVIKFDIDYWTQINDSNGTLEVFDYPKNYTNIED